MGGYSPSVLVDAALSQRIMREVIEPTVRGLLAEGRPYRGVLYAGLMLTTGGPQVLEYNARFGDPEAELIAMRLAGDLVAVMQATLAGRLDDAPIAWHPGGALCVVLAAAGYPGTPVQGTPIEGLDAVATQSERDGALVTAGGRVLTVTARGATFAEAARRCDAAAGEIRFEGCQRRRDIGRVAIEFEAAGRGCAPR
jgi:phosphoribosylamine--glycine ligase